MITPNPFTSGGARWNVMAAYGAQLEQGKTPSRPSSTSTSSSTTCRPGQERARGAADLRRGQGRRPDRVRERGDHRPAEGRGARLRRPRPDDPDREPDRGRRRRSAEAAQAFVHYLRTPAAQKIFAGEGLPPGPTTTSSSRSTYPTPPDLFTIADLGGWRDVKEKFFDRDNGIVADIERELGVPD